MDLLTQQRTGLDSARAVRQTHPFHRPPVGGQATGEIIPAPGDGPGSAGSQIVKSYYRVVGVERDIIHQPAVRAVGGRRRSGRRRARRRPAGGIRRAAWPSFGPRTTVSRPVVWLRRVPRTRRVRPLDAGRAGTALDGWVPRRAGRAAAERVGSGTARTDGRDKPQRRREHPRHCGYQFRCRRQPTHLEVAEPRVAIVVADLRRACDSPISEVAAARARHGKFDRRRPPTKCLLRRWQEPCRSARIAARGQVGADDPIPTTANCPRHRRGQFAMIQWVGSGQFMFHAARRRWYYHRQPESTA